MDDYKVTMVFVMRVPAKSVDEALQVARERLKTSTEEPHDAVVTRFRKKT